MKISQRIIHGFAVLSFSLLGEEISKIIDSTICACVCAVYGSGRNNTFAWRTCLQRKVFFNTHLCRERVAIKKRSVTAMFVTKRTDVVLLLFQPMTPPFSLHPHTHSVHKSKTNVCLSVKYSTTTAIILPRPLRLESNPRKRRDPLEFSTSS